MVFQKIWVGLIKISKIDWLANSIKRDEKKLIRVSDYTLYPSGRFSTDGEGNAEDFRTKYLLPPLKDNQQILVNLDGVNGYPASFLDAAFGGLVRDEGFDSEFIQEHVELQALELGYSSAIRLSKKYMKSPDDLEWLKTKKITSDMLRKNV